VRRRQKRKEVAKMGKPKPQIEVPTGDAEKGAKWFKGKYAHCHTIEKAGNVKQGPPLVRVMGGTCGSVEGFAYSVANKDSGIVWPLANMFEYLVNPQKYIPGTRNELISLHS